MPNEPDPEKTWYFRILIVLLVLLFPAQVLAVSITEFGAAGDGITDDTEAFRAGIASLAGGGGELYLPSGRYLILEDLFIDHAVSIVGSGHDESVITSDNGSPRLYLQVSGISFRDVGFEEMVEPIALVSRANYILENLTFDRCRFERIGTEDRSRGTIGLSSGNSFQQVFEIRNLTVKDSIFQDVDARAINIRGRITEAKILDNLFQNIVNTRPETAPANELGGYAIRLGTDETATPDDLGGQGKHLIEGNVIRRLEKKTPAGNLMAILLYGNSSVIRDNLIEGIDGLSTGDDAIAIYLRGGYNQIVFNVIREVRGADDDGAISFKGASEINYGNTVAYNVIENIYGMSAVEASTSALQFYGNVVINAPTRGFMHRTGEGILLANNTFRSADTDLRMDEGIAYILDNDFVNSRVWLSKRRDEPSKRLAIYIHGNYFSATARSSTVPMIRFSNGVEERLVSIRKNRFENASYEPVNDYLVDLAANGVSQKVEITDNHFTQNGSEIEAFHVSSPETEISGNTIVFGEYPAERPAVPSDLRLGHENDTVSLTWTGLSGLVYRLQYSNDLENWFDYGDSIAGEGNLIELEDLPEPWRLPTFYRLIVFPVEANQG